MTDDGEKYSESKDSEYIGYNKVKCVKCGGSGIDDEKKACRYCDGVGVVRGRKWQ